MVYNNRKSTDKFKKLTAILGFTYLLAVVVLLFLQEFTLFYIMAGLFLLLFILFAIINFQYLSIFTRESKLIVRYFPVFAMNRSYKSIEFPIGYLEDIEVKKYIFGLIWIIRFSVRTRRGIADYPPISLSAVPFKERHKLIEQLNELKEDSKI